VLRTPAVVLALGFAVAATAGAAHGNPAGEVTTLHAPGDADFVRAGVDYELEIQSAEITRERTGEPGADPLSPPGPRHELDYHRTRHVVTPRVEIGVYRDVWVSLALPFVIADSTEIDLAPGVDRLTSSSVVDGILPAAGFDAGNPATAPTGNVMFRGVQRRGIEELRVGVGYAPMSQARDDTQPTWKLGIDVHAAIGGAMRFDAVEPGRETGASTGVHQLSLWMSIDRRLRYFEGWLSASYQLPLASRGNSLFQNPGFGAVNVDPGQVARLGFGIEAFLTGDPASPAADTRISAELSTQMTAHFEGRGYGEMWEVFAYAGDRRTAGPLVLDADPVTPGGQDLSHPGITNLENYLETAARLALRAHIGAHASFAALGALSWRTDHVISFTDAGIDLPTCPSGAPRCETDDNTQVNPGTVEVNPLHDRRIDLVGHRYRAEHATSILVGIEARVAF
jgi:hypothetical protein